MKVEFFKGPPAKVSLVKLGATSTDLALVTRGYSGVYEDTITLDDVLKFINDLDDTKLKTPTAFVNMIWLIKDVTRNFQQQLTRYRVGTAFVAESLRFSDKRAAKFYVTAKEMPETFILACEDAVEAYESMLAAGEEIQNARGVLPGNICADMFVSMNLQTLSHIYEQRSCCQAQGYADGEWYSVLTQMAALLEREDGVLATMLKVPWENPLCVSCGFAASFDRPCKEQHRFDKNLRELAADRLGLVDGVRQVTE